MDITKPFSRGALVTLKREGVVPSHSRHKDAPASAVLMVTSCGDKRFDAVLFHDWEAVFPARGKSFSRLNVENYERVGVGTKYESDGTFSLSCRKR